MTKKTKRQHDGNIFTKVTSNFQLKMGHLPAVALFTIYYVLSVVLDLSFLFGAQGMVAYNVMPQIGPSLLFFNHSVFTIWASVVLIIFLSIAIWFEKLSYWGLGLLYFLLVSFWNANPYIIHEPQQIHSLFILTLFFWPLKSSEPVNPIIAKGLMYFLGVYYVVAAIKKLPDMSWLRGDAISHILCFSGVGRFDFCNVQDFFVSFLLRGASWFTIFFELLFVVLVQTKWRVHTLILGAFFHMGIKIFLDVGLFSEVMLVWYSLWIKKQDLAFLSRALKMGSPKVQ